ncbi:MAG: hypothetical protein ACKVZ0_15690 [Gemmatimonadales bacterium]
MYREAVTAAARGGQFDEATGSDLRSPWKGLDAYEPSDGSLFVGRERTLRQLVTTMESSTLAGIVGASGSGKSSLLLGGLSQHVDLSCVLRPGPNPRRQLREAMARCSPGPAGATPVVVVDQLEEVFTLCEEDAERSAYLDELCDMAESGTARVVVALRSDHYGSCAPYRRFADALSRSHVLVGAPTEEELRRIITVPAAAAGLRIQRGLEDEIIDDVLGEAGALPLLSHALAETWLRRTGELLTREAYRQVGGVRGAIARTAEAVWLVLPPSQQQAARAILTRLAATGSSIESSRRIPSAEIVQAGDADGAVALHALVKARLVTVDSGTAEIAHEAVFREWPRLRAWLHEDRDALRVFGQLRASARAWEEDGHDDASLYRGARLQAVVELLQSQATPAAGWTLDEVSHSFVGASVAAAERADADRAGQAERENRMNRRLRALLIAALALLVFVAGTGVFALGQRANAVDDRRSADARRIAAVAAGVRADRLDLAALLSIEAQRRDDNLDTRGALLSTITDQPGLVGYVHQDDATVDAAIDPTGVVAAIPGADRKLELWDLSGPDPALRTRIDLGEGVAAARLRFMQDGRLLVGDGAGGVRVVDPAAGTIVLEAADVGDSAVWAISASPDGAIIASSGDDGLVRLSDARTGAALQEPLTGPEDAVQVVGFSLDGQLLAAGGGDGVLRFWDTATWTTVGEPLAVESAIWDFAWLPGGDTFVVAADGFVQFFDAAKRRPVSPPLAAHDGTTYRLEVIDGGATLVT